MNGQAPYKLVWGPHYLMAITIYSYHHFVEFYITETEIHRQLIGWINELNTNDSYKEEIMRTQTRRMKRIMEV